MVGTPDAIFTRRLCEAAVSSIALHLVISRAVALTLNFDFLHPGTWLTDSLGTFSFLNFILIALMTAAQAYIYASTCIAAPRKRFSRFFMFLDLFTLQNIAFSILYALTGYVIIGFYTSILNKNYTNLRKACSESEGQCLVEKSLFLECGGMWLGLYYFLKNHIFGSAVLIFPHIHQEKVHQIRGALIGNIISGLRDSIKPTLYFIVFYIIWGHKPRNVVKDVYSLYLEDAPLDSILNMIGSGVWFTFWLYSSLFFMSMYNLKSVFVAFLTEPIVFPVNSVTTVSLLDALALRWQYSGAIAARDFRQLAFADVKRRSEVFTVSLPGGHPRTWNKLLQETLLTINSFSDEIESIHDMTPKQESVVEPPDWLNRHPLTIRNLASPQIVIKDKNENFEDARLAMIKNVIKTQMENILKKPGISYIFTELPDWKLRSLLNRAQPVMWTCEGIASLAAASLNEDKYGVVQNDLNKIISALVKLKQNLDKLTKSGLIPKRQSTDVFTLRMKTALLSSVRRSIYMITHTFAMYINDIALSPEVLSAVQPFLVFKEC